MKNWFAVEVCRDFFLTPVFGWNRSGIECLNLSNVGYPDVSPSGLHIPTLPLVQAQAEEDGEAPRLSVRGNSLCG